MTRVLIALILVFMLTSCVSHLSKMIGSKEMKVEQIANQCEAGDISACLKAGNAYRDGKHSQYNTPKDIDLATRYYTKGCTNDDKKACKELFSMYWDLYHKKKYTRGHPTLLEMYEISCNGNYGPACSILAYNYEVGSGVARNLQKALTLYEKGCSNRSSSGCRHAGDMYVSGKHVTRNAAKAKTFYEKGCNWKNVRACTGLGLLYLKGDGVKQDNGQAYSFFVRSCSSNPSDNDTIGCYNLGKLYEKGKGCEKDVEKAISLFGQACRVRPKVAEACVDLARAHQTGLGGKVDNNAAWNYYRDACELGNDKGCVEWHTDGCDRLKIPDDCEWLKKKGLY